MIEVDRWTGVTVATVETPAPAGRLAQVRFYNPASSGYQDAVPTLLVGQEAGVEAVVYNPSPYPMKMRMDTTVLSPDGSAGELVGIATVVQPGAYKSWLARWACPQVGGYRVNLVLLAEYGA